MVLQPQTLDDIDFWDLDLFSEGDPHAVWTLLRREAPVWFHDRPGGEPFWSLTRYEDCKAVHTNPMLFSSERHGIVLRTTEALAVAELGLNPIERNKPMIHTDPPRHQPLRKTISHNFTPRAVARLEDQLRRYTTSCLDDVSDTRDIDFVTDVAHRIPAAIAFALMGVPEEDWDRLAELEHITITGTDPEFTHGQSAQEAQMAAGIELFTYFSQLVEQRRDHPGEDLLSQLLAGQVLGEPVQWQQVVSEAALLLAGGLDTTRAAASAGAVLPLIAHPDQWQDLREDPSLLSTAVDEFVRWASPITSEARTVTADTELGGMKLREGDRVAMWSPSCNRDEDQFDHPFRYDIRRTNNRHLGFAYGEHYCLGVHLARLTLKVEFEEITRRFTSIELTGEPSRVRSNFVGGLKHLPVHMNPA